MAIHRDRVNREDKAVGGIARKTKVLLPSEGLLLITYSYTTDGKKGLGKQVSNATGSKFTNPQFPRGLKGHFSDFNPQDLICWTIHDDGT